VATFPLIALLLTLFLGVTAFVVKVRPAQLTVLAAARACARQGVSTLNPSRGWAQAQIAGRETLQARHLDADKATVEVTTVGSWERWAAVRCTVSYPVDVRRVPFAALFAGRPEIDLEATYTLQVDPYKSRWEVP
jgi:hypothetical protein